MFGKQYNLHTHIFKISKFKYLQCYIFLGIIIILSSAFFTNINGLDDKTDCQLDVNWYKTHYEALLAFNIVSLVIFLILTFIKNMP